MSEPTDELDQAQLRASLMYLVQLSTAQRLRKPPPAAAAERFVERMKQVLILEIPVTLQVLNDAILHEEVKVVGEDLLSLHLCRNLYGAGLRAVFIEPTVSSEELLQLAELLTQDWESRAAFEPDLPTSAWQARFASVHLDLTTNALADESQENDRVLLDSLSRQLSSSDLAAQDALEGLLSSLRALAPQADSWNAYSEESRVMLSQPRAAEALHRELEQIRNNTDTSQPQLGSLLMEMLRLAPDGATVRSITQTLIDHLLQALSEGQPEDTAFLHGPLSLLDEALFPHWPHRAVFSEALQGLSGATIWDAIQEGWQRRPEVAHWVGPLFTLSAATAASQAGRVAWHAASLPERALRQAVADGLALVQIRQGTSPSALLDATDPEAWTVALLAMARSTDATVLERILARFNSDNPDLREAVLVALRRHQSPRIKLVAREALKDDFESVRLEAMRYLAVYRDADGGSRIVHALTTLPPGSRTPAELKAMVKAASVIQGRAIIEPLKSIALRADIEERNPELLDTVLQGLFASGREGSTALDAIGLSRPALRPRIRALLGS